MNEKIWLKILVKLHPNFDLVDKFKNLTFALIRGRGIPIFSLVYNIAPNFKNIHNLVELHYSLFCFVDSNFVHLVELETWKLFRNGTNARGTWVVSCDPSLLSSPGFPVREIPTSSRENYGR